MSNVDGMQFEPGVLQSIWRFRWVFLAVVGGLTALGYASTIFQPSEDRWTASSVLVVEDPRASALFDTAPQTRGRYVANQVAVLRSTPVAELASEILAGAGFDLTPVEILDSSDVLATTGASEVIEIQFSSLDEALAIGGANAIAGAYQDVRRSEARSNYQSSIDQLDAFIASTGDRLDEIQQEIEATSVAGLQGSLQERYDSTITRLLALEATEGASSEIIQGLREELLALQSALSFGTPQSDIDILVKEQDNLQDRLSRLTQRRDEIAIDSELLGSGVLLFSPAATATAPAPASPVRNTALGVIVGIAAGAIVSYFLALRRRTFTDAAQPGAVLGAPLLASVPLFKEELTTKLPILRAPGSEAAEGFRFTVAALRHRLKATPHYPDGTPAVGPGADTPWVAFVSATSGDGKTIVAANSALAAAGEGLTVLVIDADIADPELSRVFGELRHDVVDRRTADGHHVQQRVIPGAHDGAVHLVSLRDSGDASDAGRLAGQSLRRALSLAESGEYDFVFIDVPPLLQIAYASTVASQAGTVLVVVPHGGRVSEVEEERNRLEITSMATVGYVYNKAPRRAEPIGTGGSLVAHRSALMEVASGSPEEVGTEDARVDEDELTVHGGN